MEKLAKYGFDGSHLCTEGNRQMLSEDTPEQRYRDRVTRERWYMSQGVDLEAEA